MSKLARISPILHAAAAARRFFRRPIGAIPACWMMDIVRLDAEEQPT